MPTLSETTAALLVGGTGTRLRPVVQDRPKVLAQIHDRPFLAYLLDQLAEAGIGRVVLCTGFRADMVQKEFGETYQGMALEFSPEEEALGTGGALRLALARFRSNPVLVMNGDSCCGVDLQQFMNFYQTSQARAALVLTQVPDCGRYGSVQLDAQDHILKFGEKEATSGPGWINAGIYLLDLSLIEAIPASTQVSLEREVFPRWIGSSFYGFRAPGPFIDIGTPESYARAFQFFSSASQKMS
jgi:D-glycero-alpha-D-manno-heptose 1-phosphate guanylyltransferase